MTSDISHVKGCGLANQGQQTFVMAMSQLPWEGAQTTPLKASVSQRAPGEHSGELSHKFA